MAVIKVACMTGVLLLVGASFMELGTSVRAANR